MLNWKADRASHHVERVWIFFSEEFFGKKYFSWNPRKLLTKFLIYLWQGTALILNCFQASENASCYGFWAGTDFFFPSLNFSEFFTCSDHLFLVAERNYALCQGQAWLLAPYTQSRKAFPNRRTLPESFFLANLSFLGILSFRRVAQIFSGLCHLPLLWKAVQKRYPRATHRSISLPEGSFWKTDLTCENIFSVCHHFRVSLDALLWVTKPSMSWPLPTSLASSLANPCPLCDTLANQNTHHTILFLECGFPTSHLPLSYLSPFLKTDSLSQTPECQINTGQRKNH